MALIKNLYKGVMIACILPAVSILLACNESSSAGRLAPDTITYCTTELPHRIALRDSSYTGPPKEGSTTGRMKWIPGGRTFLGAADREGREDEYPRHEVELEGYWMDETEVTNASFRDFVEATGYVTTAERSINWDELKKQLPAGTLKPPDSMLQPSSLVFEPPSEPVTLNDPSQWWHWKKGASWRHPKGPGSDINGKDDHPVVHISWDDAMAYCKWAGKRLPTESEWEHAASAGKQDNRYPWGSEQVEAGSPKSNTWQGHFPDRNTGWDSFYGSAPVKSFAPNAYGLYDMAGNVWEWCSDWYHPAYYEQLKGHLAANPQGAGNSYDPAEPHSPKKVVRGGSFLCHDSYCKGYRVTARMKTSPDTGLEHTGFRCVKDGPAKKR